MNQIIGNLKNFELISQHLNFKEILSLTQVSIFWNNSVGNSKNCMSKIQLNLHKTKSCHCLTHAACLNVSQRKYQNVLINCHGNSEASEIFVKVLKRFERSVLNLDVLESAYRWDACNTLKCEDKVLVLTELKSLRIASSNDHLAEILFISCTYLNSLTVQHVRLNKYFHHCLKVNEKLKFLKIMNPRTIYDTFNYDHFNFKLDHFGVHRGKEFDVDQIDLLRKIIVPLAKSQLCNIKSMILENITVTNLHDLIFDSNFIRPSNLRVTINDKFISFKADEIQITAGNFTNVNYFNGEFAKFLVQNSDNIRAVTLSGIDDDNIIKFVISGMPILQSFTLGSSSKFAWLRSKKISKIETTATDLHELKDLLRISQNLKALRVFEITKELTNFIELEMTNLVQLEYYFIQPKCFDADKKFIRLNFYDPIMRISAELHELIFQHLSDLCTIELTKTWTTFHFEQ